jgi:hypothetical protein
MCRGGGSPCSCVGEEGSSRGDVSSSLNSLSCSSGAAMTSDDGDGDAGSMSSVDCSAAASRLLPRLSPSRRRRPHHGHGDRSCRCGCYSEGPICSCDYQPQPHEASEACLPLLTRGGAHYPRLQPLYTQLAGACTAAAAAAAAAAVCPASSSFSQPLRLMELLIPPAAFSSSSCAAAATTLATTRTRRRTTIASPSRQRRRQQGEQQAEKGEEEEGEATPLPTRRTLTPARPAAALDRLCSLLEAELEARQRVRRRQQHQRHGAQGARGHSPQPAPPKDKEVKVAASGTEQHCCSLYPRFFSLHDLHRGRRRTIPTTHHHQPPEQPSPFSSSFSSLPYCSCHQNSDRACSCGCCRSLVLPPTPAQPAPPAAPPSTGRADLGGGLPETGALIRDLEAEVARLFQCRQRRRSGGGGGQQQQQQRQRQQQQQRVAPAAVGRGPSPVRRRVEGFGGPPWIPP